MPIEQITPDTAKEMMDADKDTVYLDVRSVPEFEQGHADGAINIPLLHLNASTGMMDPNPDFAAVAQSVLAPKKTCVVGCKMGGRSQKACDLLAMLGYEKLFNIDGGYGGNDHQKGWKDLNLPISQENGEGVGYECLKAK